MKKTLAAVMLGAALLAQPILAQPKTYDVDGAHSRVGFSVTHLQLSEVEGRFGNYQGTINWDADKPANSKIKFTVKADSIDTGNDQRDGHLKSPDFFDTAKYPTLTFETTSVEPLSGNRYALTGDLTMHGVTKRVTVPATIKGPVDAMGQGNLSLGFSTSFKVNRIDYGVGSGWKGGSDKIVGHDVFVSIKGEAHQGK